MVGQKLISKNVCIVLSSITVNSPKRPNYGPYKPEARKLPLFVWWGYFFPKLSVSILPSLNMITKSFWTYNNLKMSLYESKSLRGQLSHPYHQPDISFTAGCDMFPVICSEPLSTLFMGFGHLPTWRRHTESAWCAREGYRDAIDISIPPATLILHIGGALPTF